MKRQKIPREEWPQNYLSTTHADATAHHFEHDDGRGYIVIVTLGSRKGRTREEIYGLLVHEGVHIWQAIRRSMGEHNPAVEQEAYAIQHIAQQLMQSYRDQTARKR